MRHGYCTWLFERGVDELTAAYYMGHKDSKTTREIYTHLREKQKRKAAAKLLAGSDDDEAARAAEIEAINAFKAANQ